MDSRYPSPWIQRSVSSPAAILYPPVQLASDVAMDEPLDLRVKPVAPATLLTPGAPLDLTTASKTSMSSPIPRHLMATTTPADLHRTASGSPRFQGSTTNTMGNQQLAPDYNGLMQHVFSLTQANMLGLGEPIATPKRSISTPGHSADVKLHCSYCGYQCSVYEKESFNVHLSQHKPHLFSCCHCKKPLPDQMAVREHILVHQTLNHFICSSCCVAFSNQTLFTSHMCARHGSLQVPSRYPTFAEQLSHNLGPSSASNHIKQTAGKPFSQRQMSEGAGSPSLGLTNPYRGSPLAFFRGGAVDQRSGEGDGQLLKYVNSQKQFGSSPSIHNAMKRSMSNSPGTSGSTDEGRMSASPFRYGTTEVPSVTTTCPPSYGDRRQPPPISRAELHRPSSIASSMEGQSSASLSPAVGERRSPPQTFGQSLAKQIEAAISHHVADGKKPSLTDLMFMKTQSDDGDSSATGEQARPSSSNGLNLMSLLNKVVEENIRSSSAEKPDLKFMVTFSDEEEETEAMDDGANPDAANHPRPNSAKGDGESSCTPSNNADKLGRSSDTPEGSS